MTKVSDIGSRKKPEPVCRHCGAVPESEHPFYSCPRIAGVQEFEDATIFEYVQTYAVQVTHHVTSEPAPPGADEKAPD